MAYIVQSYRKETKARSKTRDLSKVLQTERAKTLIGSLLSEYIASSHLLSLHSSLGKQQFTFCLHSPISPLQADTPDMLLLTSKAAIRPYVKKRNLEDTFELFLLLSQVALKVHDKFRGSSTKGTMK